MPRNQISPMPPVAEGVGLPWDVPVADAVAELAAARSAFGDTFVVDSGRDRYLFTFTPTGVESFYALPEADASKGVADYLMLRRKLPDEIFDGRRTLPGTLFRKGDVASYLINLESALEVEIAELRESGSVDVFGLTRRLGHRMGLASWAGPGAAEGETFEALVRAFDALDGADSFVHPDAMQAVAASGYANERAALAEIVDLLSDVVTEGNGHVLFDRIALAWADEPDSVRRTGIAHDVVLIHIASMSNLASALGWALVDLVENPSAAQRVRAGDQEHASRCALESIRLAQRSIMARTVLSPVVFDDGEMTYEVGHGTTIATLLPLTNRTPELGHDIWDPERWDRHRFTDTGGLGSAQLVTSFGHGKHSCPAQPFSLAATTLTMTRLLATFDLSAGWSSYPVPVPAQIGGVARADDPCPMAYRRLSRGHSED
ncbi:cytochrome P450 [Aeromicrobium panaciterrae]|uniref:Cytochrome P450 n=1 Tax=Aeromicrobium panaciterrae TaxID=363861 RepID=A0ABU1UMA2_9ACTN|nr:cytochrome P450 [Aeromicrobium panaciterrae]MDR7086312.1 cytochrome P450 [Aeromicrobium panaciterrae]